MTTVGGIKKGDQFAWDREIHVVVTRVAKDGAWADLECWSRHGGSWGKRQPLPLPDSFIRVS